MEVGNPVEVVFFGDNPVTGIVDKVDKRSTTIVFGQLFESWTVTIPKSWVRKNTDRLVVELA